MKNRSSSWSSLALGSLTATVALLTGLSGAQAQAPAPSAPLSGAGSFPLSFIVPGTNTSLHVGGFVQLDMNYDMSAVGNANSPGALDNMNPPSIELSGNGVGNVVGVPGNAAGHTDHGVYVETRTPTNYGEVKTYIEIDFAGNQDGGGSFGSPPGATQTNFNQTSLARLKQAYGTLGPFLFGMANSNYADLASLPDQLDGFVEAGGFMGAGEAKVVQARYTYLLPMGITASVAIEGNQTGGIASNLAATTTGGGTIVGGSGTTFATFNNFNQPGLSQGLPALTSTVQIQQPWGHAGFHIAVAQARIKDFSTTATTGGVGFPATYPSGSHISRWGYMLSQTGHFNTFGKDKITWNFVYGQGASNYTWATNDLGTQWEEDLVCSGNATSAAAANSLACSQPRVMGVNAGYSHWWTDEWRSGVSFGADRVSRPNAAANWNATALPGGGVPGNTTNALANLERAHYSADANLLWTPVAGVQLGIEYEWYHRVVWSGAHGSSNRLETQALFAF